MNKHAPNSEKAQDSGVDLEQLSKVSTSGLEPWMNPSRSADERFAAYKEFVFQKLEEIRRSYKRADSETLKQLITNDPDTQAYIREGHLLAKMDAVSFNGQFTPLFRAAVMMSSYSYDKTTGVSTFTVPAGVTDVEAMKALNEYGWKHRRGGYPLGAVCNRFFEWYKKLPEKYPEYWQKQAWSEAVPKVSPGYCQKRDYSQARQITITAVVEGTLDKEHTDQEAVLREKSLVFADPRDQALAAAIHACKNDGEDLFQGFHVRGSVPGFSLVNTKRSGVWVEEYACFCHFAASGSPSPELKKT